MAEERVRPYNQRAQRAEKEARIAAADEPQVVKAHDVATGETLVVTTEVDTREMNADGEFLNKDGSVSKRQ